LVRITEQNRRWWILAAMSGVLGLVVLDETVVGVALPTIRAELAMSQVASHWVVNAYLLTFTGFVALGGRLGDSLEHRGFFVVGIAIFGLASLVAGFAGDGGSLIAARALQGIGAAIVFPASWAMMTAIFPLEQRGLAFGIQTMVGGVFMALGPLVGGFFAEAISWRWIFWINLPVVAGIALVLLAAWASLQERGTAPAAIGRGSPDVVGLITLVVGLGALVIGLMEGTEWGWGAPATLALLGAGVLLLSLFAATELRTSEPLLEIGLLRITTFTGGNLVFFMFQFDKIVVFVFVPLYLQHVLHWSPIEAGVAVLIAVLPTLVTSVLAGRLADRFGSRPPLLTGLLLNGSALILVGLGTAYDDYPMVVAPLVVWGATLPLLAVPARRALMSAVPKTRQGQASGVNLTIQMLGGTVGMALCGTLLVMTGDYRSLFVLTGALIFATWLCAWRTVERPTRPLAALG
jgi:EmrB/QacA subfamily drug resistance transporter